MGRVETATSAEEPVSDGGIAAATATFVRAVRREEWREGLEGELGTFAQALDCHRAVIFRLQEMPGRGFVQLNDCIWSDPEIAATREVPAELDQEMVDNDPFLRRLATDGRHGKVFQGHTRDLEGILAKDFQRQGIQSFLSYTIFANGHLWGMLGINDCVQEREWTADEQAAMELATVAIGNAVERSSSDAHVSEVIRTALIHGALDGVIVLDEVGNIIEFNPAAERMFGWKKEEVLGSDVLHLLIPPFYRKGYSNGGEYMAGRGAPMLGRRMETLTTHRSGEIFPVELTASEVRVAGRRLMIGSIRDLRPQRQAESEIDRQRERLHQNEKMAAMGSLLAGVSHELNNPLAVVVAQSTLLHEFASDPQTKVRAEKVRAAAERCGRIVKSFLGMVRLRPPAQADTDINAVVRAALEVTAYGARTSGIGVSAELATESLLVTGDADHLTQVVANFLVNSQHALAGQSGERRIKVRTFRNGARCGFSVEDNGPGVPNSIRDRIFESYFTTKPVGVGTGIGLSISRSIIERHNGKLWLEDVEPQGARFVVDLPAQSAVHRSQSASDTRSKGLHRALIIDDEPDVAASLADILELMGVKSRVATAWTSAADMLDGQDIDIMFCDLRMPGIDGATIYRAVLERHPDLARRFVIVTGDLLGARAEMDMLPGSLRPQLLEKPFSTLDVRSTLVAVEDQSAIVG